MNYILISNDAQKLLDCIYKCYQNRLNNNKWRAEAAIINKNKPLLALIDETFPGMTIHHPNDLFMLYHVLHSNKLINCPSFAQPPKQEDSYLRIEINLPAIEILDLGIAHMERKIKKLKKHTHLEIQKADNASDVFTHQ